MVELKIVINDSKTGKTYQKTLPENLFVGRKIKDKVNGAEVGMPGYDLEITGGSDSSGFPMRLDIEGPERKKILVSGGVGVTRKTINRKGMRVKKTVVGNTVSDRIVQVNLKIIKHGAKTVEEVLGIVPKEAAKSEAA
ncbi:30S ribosomal protein S6e [Candidatus Woesearchaeota archaeon]|nr:30S ribosomal protein S6e [Candidatus Woesearchaeota archaeon]